MDFEDEDIEILYEKFIYPELRAMVGQRYKLAHLKSERGRQLNGKICKVIGFDHNLEARLHCRLEENKPKKSIKAKAKHLIPYQEATEAMENFMSTSPPIPDKILKQYLRRALVTNEENMFRTDQCHRIGLYRELLLKIEAGTASAERGDYCFPCGAGFVDTYESQRCNRSQLAQILKPACYGNEICDMRYMDIGLKGDNCTECAICQEVLAADDTANMAIVTLPCLHAFHEPCIRQWLGSDLGAQNWNCPSCRKTVPGNMSKYCIKYDEQLQNRFDEFPLSAFCAKCMIMVFEIHRHDRNHRTVGDREGTP